MLVNVFYDSIMRYFFNTGSIAMQEMEWHLFSVVFLFGMAYTLKEDGHVRVDILYDLFSPRWKATVNIGGALLLLIPLCLLIIEGSFWYVHEAFSSGEISGDPGGLGYRWLIKSVIPVSFVFLVISTIGFVLHNINIFRGIEAPTVHHIEDKAIL
jgi:TRAP-type mannitol/chloroaromatic compound transport system permease small subunit